MDTINYGLLKGLLKQVVASGVLKGEPGKGFVILGTYDSLELLKAAVTKPSPGDSYNIGTSEPYDVYQWDGVKKDWINLGSLKGDKGDKGDTGDKGRDGVDGTNGKSAYQYAQEAGYEGSENDFSRDLNLIPSKVYEITVSIDDWIQENDYWKATIKSGDYSQIKCNISFPDFTNVNQLMEDGVVYIVGVTDLENLMIKCYGAKPTVSIKIQIEEIYVKEVV